MPGKSLEIREGFPLFRIKQGSLFGITGIYNFSLGLFCFGFQLCVIIFMHILLVYFYLHFHAQWAVAKYKYVPLKIFNAIQGPFNTWLHFGHLLLVILFTKDLHLSVSLRLGKGNQFLPMEKTEAVSNSCKFVLFCFILTDLINGLNQSTILMRYNCYIVISVFGIQANSQFKIHQKVII